jgi:hypothetical protein
LPLLKLYGKRGRVVEDPRVVAMLDDQNPPPVNSDSAKKLLRLLRALDDAWRNDRSGPLLNDIRLPDPSDTFDKPGSYSAEVPDKMTAASPRQHSHGHPSTSKAAGPEESVSVETARYSSRGKTIFMD